MQLEQLFSSIELIEHSQFDLYLVNPDTLKIECCSQGLQQSTGYTRQELLEMHLYDLNAEFSKKQFLRLLKPLKEGEKPYLIFNTQRVHKNGELIPVTGCIQYLHHGHRQPRLVIMVHEDRAELDARKPTDLADALLSQHPLPIAVLDEAFQVQRVNAEFLSLLGLSKDETQRKPICDLFFENHQSTFPRIQEALKLYGGWKGIVWQTLADGRLKPLHVNAQEFILSSKNKGYLFTFEHQVKPKNQVNKAHAELSLTGLPNRNQFSRLLHNIMQRQFSENERLVLFHIDIQKFKKINDRFGHRGGDEILVAVANRIANVAAQSAIAGNLAADEFVLLHFTDARASSIKTQVEKLQKKLRAPFNLFGKEIYIQTKIGVAIGQPGKCTPDTLMDNAEHAVNQAKLRDDTDWCIYSHDAHRKVVERFEKEDELRRAVENNEFQLYFQPQLDLSSGKIKSAEALIRWQHPHRGLLGPGEFVDLLEETGLIVELGEWILRHACHRAANWLLKGYEPIQVAVNVSAQQLAQDNFVDIVKSALMDSGLDAKYLELEVTESSVLNNAEDSADKLRQLSEYGVTIAMDDFGTGYSSLSYLSQLPLDVLKIDQSFVRGLPDDKHSVEIVNMIIAMAKSLNLTVVAEGVENEKQSGFLKQSGCHKLQGYLITQPIPPHEVDQFLQLSCNRSLVNNSITHMGVANVVASKTQ